MMMTIARSPASYQRTERVQRAIRQFKKVESLDKTLDLEKERLTLHVTGLSFAEAADYAEATIEVLNNENTRTRPQI